VNTKTVSIAGTCLVPIDPALLKQCPLGEEVEVDVSAERDALVIRPVRRQPRQGWAEALAAVPDYELARDQADLTAFRETPHDWDSKDWEW
jgi:antitoxin component of MazEF toxin-antitoxin module